jgi:hypothetical protein
MFVAMIDDGYLDGFKAEFETIDICVTTTQAKMNRCGLNKHVATIISNLFCISNSLEE